MKLITLYFILILITNNTTWAKGIRNEILEVLPSNLNSLNQKNTRKDLEIKFSSKIAKKEDPNALYLNYFDEKNDVTIGTENGKFSYLYLEPPQNIIKSKESLYQKVLTQLSERQKKSISKENENQNAHDLGKYLIIDLPEEGLKIEFENNEKKLIHSIIVYPEKKK